MDSLQFSRKKLKKLIEGIFARNLPHQLLDNSLGTLARRLGVLTGDYTFVIDDVARERLSFAKLGSHFDKFRFQFEVHDVPCIIVEHHLLFVVGERGHFS